MKNFLGINWTVRLRHPMFWTALFALVGFILVDSGVIEAGKYETYVELIMGLLIAAGFITDMTTKGFEDSDQAKNYDEPRG